MGIGFLCGSFVRTMRCRGETTAFCLCVYSTVCVLRREGLMLGAREAFLSPTPRAEERKRMPPIRATGPAIEAEKQNQYIFRAREREGSKHIAVHTERGFGGHISCLMQRPPLLGCFCLCRVMATQRDTSPSQPQPRVLRTRPCYCCC